MFGFILTACVGNICRSPMAEGLLHAHLRNDKIKIESAGLDAIEGQPADPTAVRLMKQKGCDISRHRSRPITSELIRAADLILVMEKWQRYTLESEFKWSRGKVYVIGHWQGFDVPDPYGKSESTFQESLCLIEWGVTDWKSRLH